MKRTRTLCVLTLVLVCIGIMSIVTVRAVAPEPSAHGSAQSGDLMLTLSAVQHQDGTVDGHAMFRDRAANTKVDIDIDCLLVSAGMGDSQGAILSGTVTRSTSLDLPVGSSVAFMVRDNGEGQNAPPDQFTPPGTSKGPCVVGMISGLLNSEQGNIVVNGGAPAN